MKHMKVLGILCVVAQLCFGAEMVVFQSDFANNRDLSGWKDAWNRPKVRDDFYKVVEENGEVFYQVQKTADGKQLMFGLSHKLDSSIVVNDSLDKVILEVTVRKHKGNSSYMAGAALSSRVSLEGNQGQAFEKGKDSGFQMTGNDYPQHFTGNFILWQKDGDVVKLHPQTQPANFMSALETWLNWKLVYDHTAKELRFYRDGKDEKPFVVQRNVNLDGVVLQSVWLAGYSHEYKNVTVTTITK